MRMSRHGAVTRIARPSESPRALTEVNLLAQRLHTAYLSTKHYPYSGKSATAVPVFGDGLARNDNYLLLQDLLILRRWQLIEKVLLLVMVTEKYSWAQAGISSLGWR